MTESETRHLRSEVSHLAANWLTDAGHDLWLIGWGTRNRDVEAVALVTQMVGQLGQASADAFDVERWYAANALLRQIVEVHYLMAVFRDDPPQRQRWLDASTNRIEKSFRPSQMRLAGGFRPSEYKQHCEWGGHPNPSARWMLPCHSGNIHPSTLVADLALHLTETVDLLADLLIEIPHGEALATHLPQMDELLETSRRWRSIDPLSKRLQALPPPGSTAEFLNHPDPDADGVKTLGERP